MASISFPPVTDTERVGSYPAQAFAGGGYVWDEVLEYRVWMYLRDGAENVMDDCDYYYAFASYEEAAAWSKAKPGAQPPLALIRQLEYIDEPESGKYVHVKKERVAEWPVEFLARPRRDETTIANFLAPDAPANRLDILRGLAK